jgi:23S rRNA pseudouridine1911/1915/1917 synthase
MSPPSSERSPSILFEDNQCIAVNKPAGLLTQGVPQGLPTLEAWVKDYLRTKYHKPGNVYLGVPHRLDRCVSGVIVFARNSKSAARLAEQFQSHRVEKVYWAIVEGRVEEPSSPWVDWLRKIPEEARSEVVPPNEAEGKEAILQVTVMATAPDQSYLELLPKTGRMHQLRIQTANRGHPILGDALYGSKTTFGPFTETVRDRPIALHARSLTFLHPIQYEPLTVTAELPDYWPPDMRETR